MRRLTAVACVAVLGCVMACRQAAPPPTAPATASPLATRAAQSPTVSGTPAPASPPAPDAAGPRRDLRADERDGGHTLARHVGRSDEQLRDRLRRERGINAASTYEDLVTAEQVVGEALAASTERIAAWAHRAGSRPNLPIDYTASRPVGRSLSRGARAATGCAHVLVVLRWSEREGRYYVLTSYPECRR